MRKKIILLLFIIPLLVIPFMKVGADNKSGYKYITSVERTNYRIDVSQYGINNAALHRGNFYKIELDGMVALCLKANHPIIQGHKYVFDHKINTSSFGGKLLVKAFVYASSNKCSSNECTIARAAAQIVAWKYDWGFTSYQLLSDSDYITGNAIDYSVRILGDPALYKALSAGLKNFPHKSRSIDEEAYKQFVNILNTEIPEGVEFGVWRDAQNSNNQDVISYALTEETKPVVNETCKSKIYNRLSSCYGSYGTFGYAYETTEGNCLDGYNKKKNNVYSRLGKKEVDAGSYCRMYCNKRFYETLPGNIGTAVNVGRYIVWPNNNINNNRYKVNANLAEYPMALAIEKECYLSVDAKVLGTDYTTALNSYNNYINSIRGIYNTYVKDSRTCKTYQNTYNEKKKEADDYCKNVGPEYKPKETCGEPYWHCTESNPKTKECIHGSTFADCEETQEHKDWAAKNEHCNTLRGYENDAKSTLDKCNNIQNYVDAVANIVNDFNSCINYKASFNMDFKAPGASASYNDDEYGMTMMLKESKKVITCDGCTSDIGDISVNKDNVEKNLISNKTIPNKITAINNRQIIGTTLKYYDLTDGHYYFVNKDTNKSVNSNSELKNYSIIGFTNMPISYSANPKKNYDLSITIPTLTGMASDFASLAASNNYVCHYKVTKTTPGTCICPEGTKHAGESLDCLSRNNDGTCLDNQEEYCNSDANIPHDCTNTDLTCPNDPTMDLSSCVNAGKTYNWCVKNFCSGNKKWVCPAGTNEGMDLTSCVIPMIIKGYSENDAYNYCQDVTCPYKGIKIIYRVIDLTNPFPSKDADSIVTQRDLKTGMFNDTLKGRYPGSNWNSTKVVKSRILNNRNVDGDKVYDKKPLYEFTLNTERIRAIRNYNRSQKDSYANFKLDCLNDNSACISSFVHSELSGLTGGTCRNITKNSFYSCQN